MEMIGVYIFTISVFISLTILLFAKHYNSNLLVCSAKPSASISFLVLALISHALLSKYGIIILGALTFSVVGDILLLKNNNRFFIAGLISFLIAHVFFIIAFLIQISSFTYLYFTFVPCLIFSFAIACWLIPKVERELKIPVIIYMLVITIMLSCAIASFYTTTNYLILIGALLFYFSDLSVARDRFCAAGILNLVWGLTFYYTAQVLLIFSIHYTPHSADLN